MTTIRALLFGMLALALLLAPPLRAQFDFHSAPSIDVTAVDGHAHHDHGHSHDVDEPGHAGHNPHNPGDHSHETAVAVRLVDPMAVPIPRTILIIEAMDGLSQTHFRLERPPRLS